MSAAYLALQAKMAAKQAALMQQVGLDTNELSAASKPVAPPKPPRDRSKKRQTELIIHEATRKSSRRDKTDNNKTEEEIRQDELNAQYEAEVKAEQHKLKHGERAVQTMPPRNVAGATISGSIETLQEMFKEMAACEAPVVDPKHERDESEDAIEELKEDLQKLELRGIVRVVPERIYSLAVHPHPTKDLVFVGDKVGHMGLWDATTAHITSPKVANGSIRTGGDDSDNEQNDVGIEQVEGPHWHWRAHLQNTISSIKFRPHDAASVFSSAYDATIRRTNFETASSEEILDADLFGDENLVHSFDFTPDGHNIYAVDNGGGLIHRDLRAPMNTARRWHLDKHKVGSICLNPANPQFAITAHLKRYIRLWDLNKMANVPDNALEADTMKSAMVLQYEHQKACSSAYFDTSGTKLISTSYDDYCRVWDVDPKKLGKYRAPFHPDIALEHNNQVGRCKRICVKAQWCPAPSTPLHFAVASMDRELELYSPEGEILAALTGAQVSAVPAITASHPLNPNRYFGGTGSGKVSFFTTPYRAEGEEDVVMGDDAKKDGGEEAVEA